MFDAFQETMKLYTVADNQLHGIKALIGICWVIVIIILWERYAQKVRGIIMLRFELITFRFVYGKPKQTSFL